MIYQHIEPIGYATCLQEQVDFNRLTEIYSVYAQVS